MKSKNSSLPTLCIILPAFNEAKVIVEVIKNLKQFCQKTLSSYKVSIVVVDDGSTDGTAEQISNMVDLVLVHVLNRGLGGALTTGMTFAKNHNFDYALTMDSDGQHQPLDIITILEPLIDGTADVVIGSRFVSNTNGIPKDRIVLNWLSNVLTWIMFGIWTTDSQSGFRAFNAKALHAINLRTQGMEVSSEYIAEIKKHQLRLSEVPISVLYTEYSRMKGQTNWNSLNIVFKLFLRLFR